MFQKLPLPNFCGGPWVRILGEVSSDFMSRPKGDKGEQDWSCELRGQKLAPKRENLPDFPYIYI